MNYCFIKGYVTCNKRKNVNGVPSHYGTDIMEYPNILKKKSGLVACDHNVFKHQQYFCCY